MEQNNKIVVAVVALLIGIIAGYFFGAQSGKNAVREEQKKMEELQKSLEVFVPPLPDVINVVGGKITAINGDTFMMEIPSLTDRYPHPNRSQATETRTVKTTEDTAITETSFDPKTFKNGLPQETTISAKDLKAGDVVSVTVSENVRTEQNLTAISINRSGGI